MRFAFIHKHRQRWPVVLMCRLLAVSRSGYYAWARQPESRQSLRRRRLTKMIQIVHAESDATYGSPRVHRDLLAGGQPLQRQLGGQVDAGLPELLPKPGENSS